jgi:REP element-mobilizing transposase RayT
MPQSLVMNYVHITFSTKHRKNLIDENIEKELFNYLGGICNNLECSPLIIGGFRNHVHILCKLSRKIALMKLIEELKSHSSKWVKNRCGGYKNFYWQKGYGGFSVNPKQVDVVKSYIANQKEHHQKKTFKEEFLAFLHQYEIEYDERYVWD